VDRANVWLKEQRNVTILNMQSVMVQEMRHGETTGWSKKVSPLLKNYLYYLQSNELFKSNLSVNEALEYCKFVLNILRVT